MSEPKTAMLSIDFDFFVREMIDWDWGHNESPIFLNVVWPFRYAGIDDLKEEVDPRTHADFWPPHLRAELQKKGFLLSTNVNLMAADSHYHTLQMLRQCDEWQYEPDYLINIDQHHDLFSDPKDGEPDCGNWWTEYVDKWKKTRHIWIAPKHLDSMKDYGKPVRDVEQVRWSEFELPEPVVVTGIFFARSGCWVPPHLDELFNEMVNEFHPNLKVKCRELDWEMIEVHREQLKEQRREWEAKIESERARGSDVD